MLKALVIGCGRVGSAVALQLHQEGWDVTVVDENEDALSRLGEIGEEMVATAVKLAQERGADVVALHVIRVPLDQPLDAELFDEEERAAASLAEAAALGVDLGVEVEARSIRARSIGEAIVQAAEEAGADLIVLGSSPRWRRQSRFFSPTVDYVLRKSPAEVLIVAFPQGALEEPSGATLQPG